MRTVFTTFGTRMSLALLGVALFLPTIAMSATSTSYKLHSNFGNEAVKNVAGSTNYTITDGQLTWQEQPLASTSYQIVPVTMADTASSSSSSSSGGSSGGSGGGSSGGTNGGGTGGGRRSDPPISSSSSSTPAGRPSAPEIPVRPNVPEEIGDLSSSIASSRATVTVLPKLLSFFDAVDGDPSDGTGNRGDIEWNRVALTVIFIPLLTFLFAALCFILAWVRHARMIRKRKTKRTKNRSTNNKKLLSILLLLAILISQLPLGDLSFAAQTAPVTNVYNGRLLDSSGAAVTSAQSIRFSYWRSTDAAAGDVTGTGAINTGATNYAGWTEVHTVTPNSTGHFSVTLGSVTALPNFATMATSDLISLYLQVEVKPSASANTAYELLDTDGADTAVDRSGILSVPFAMNADLIDKREIGTSSGSIALLGPSGRFPDSVAPDGTNSGTYVIDADNTETANIVLQFGTTLSKKLTYDVDDTIFRFNDDVDITGNLTVSGLINGINLSSLQSSTGALKASSGGGLNLNVANGAYRLNGTLTSYAGGALTVTASATNYVFFGSGGLAKNLTGFPSDESYIPVAIVTTSAGAITSILDRRALSSDDREQTIVNVMNPAFEKASYQGDATDNVGQLSVSHDSTNKKNFYLWTSTRSSLQDYDIYLKLPLSSDFVRWKTSATENPLSVTYRSTHASSANNQLDIAVYDTNGSPVTLSGSVTAGSPPVDLANTSWTTTDIEFTGSPVWTAGQEMLVKFTVSAKSDYQIHVGGLTLRYVNFLSE